MADLRLHYATALYLTAIVALVLAVSSALAWHPEWATLWLVLAIYTRHRAAGLRAAWREARP